MHIVPFTVGNSLIYVICSVLLTLPPIMIKPELLELFETAVFGRLIGVRDVSEAHRRPPTIHVVEQLEFFRRVYTLSRFSPQSQPAQGAIQSSHPSSFIERVRISVIQPCRTDAFPSAHHRKTSDHHKPSSNSKPGNPGGWGALKRDSSKEERSLTVCHVRHSQYPRSSSSFPSHPLNAATGPVPDSVTPIANKRGRVCLKS
ncbi:hypothetical protein Hypma_003211 [Hypsizygus marmoreus]|uniref:Uncharacterized protein n=1 Tax=Hypsizygus marmoreus TaxID=39966 RepID=A0A369K4S8_HYPMA|nr:hypothetical protein Hypma_003211 [Hypsizygus marmoreus]